MHSATRTPPHQAGADERTPTPFRVDVHPAADAVRVVPAGELDIATAAQLDARIDELRHAGAHTVLLDLRHVEFIDSSGLQLTLKWDAELRRQGRGFAVLPGPARVQRVFAIAGLLDVLPFRATA